MQHKIKFSIDNKDFFCDADLARSKQFIIHSTPKDYVVNYEDNKQPFTSVTSLLQNNKKNLLLIDKQLLNIYKPDLNVDAGRIFAAEAAEEFKTFDRVMNIVDFLQKHEITKGEQLIVVGGGIIQDVGAFVGAVYKRGIPWVYFPSTLLSMCDSCIGGKTGVNYNGVKNQLALFSSPTVIHIHPLFLNTLSENEIHSGLGEILKLCIIGGKYFIDLYRNHVKKGKITSSDSFETLIMAALCVKKAVVEEDEFELNYRRSMNYGHTVGHAIEALSSYEIPHGQAVVVGMVIANELSYMLGLLNQQELTAINELCFELINDRVLSCLKKMNLDSIISLIQKDKKTVGKQTSFVLLQSVGNIQFVQLELNENFSRMMANNKQLIGN